MHRGCAAQREPYVDGSRCAPYVAHHDHDFWCVPVAPTPSAMRGRPVGVRSRRCLALVPHGRQPRSHGLIVVVHAAKTLPVLPHWCPSPSRRETKKRPFPAFPLVIPEGAGPVKSADLPFLLPLDPVYGAPMRRRSQGSGGADRVAAGGPGRRRRSAHAVRVVDGLVVGLLDRSAGRWTWLTSRPVRAGGSRRGGCSVIPSPRDRPNRSWPGGMMGCAASRSVGVNQFARPRRGQERPWGS